MPETPAMNPIPQMTEEDRRLRAEFERHWLKRSLTMMQSDDLDPADLCKLMHHYCQLKKEDNAHDKNLVSVSIAQSRFASAARRPRPRETQKSSLVRDSLLAPTSAEIPSRDPAQPSSTSTPAQPPIASTQSTPSTQSTLSTPSTDPTNSPFAIDNSDPDIDPEWSLAPYGRRRNGKPRTEEEFRTILHGAVRDIYGLNTTELAEKHRPDRTARATPTPEMFAPASSPTSDIYNPISDIPQPTSNIPDPPSPPAPNNLPRAAMGTICKSPPLRDTICRVPWRGGTARTGAGGARTTQNKRFHPRQRWRPTQHGASHEHGQ